MSKFNATLIRRLIPIKRNLAREIAIGKRCYSDIKSNYRIRNITESDIPRLAEIRKNLKLHDCLSSLQTFYKLDPEAMIVAEDENGQIVGTHSMIRVSKGLYLTGLTYVQPDYRKSTLSMQLLRQGAVRHRIENRLLVGFTFEAWLGKLSDLLGFRIEEGFVLNRHISAEDVDIDALSDDLPQNVRIEHFEDCHLNIIQNYDLQVANCERPKLLELSTKEPNTKTMVALKNGLCVGYSTVKLTCPGAKRVGPLYADDPKVAESLLKSLLKTFQEGKGLVMVIPSPNLEAQKLMNKLNIPLNDKLYQVYEKGFPHVALEKAYAHFDVNGSCI